MCGVYNVGVCGNTSESGVYNVGVCSYVCAVVSIAYIPVANCTWRPVLVD